MTTRRRGDFYASLSEGAAEDLKRSASSAAAVLTCFTNDQMSAVAASRPALHSGRRDHLSPQEFPLVQCATSGRKLSTPTSGLGAMSICSTARQSWPACRNDLRKLAFADLGGGVLGHPL